MIAAIVAAATAAAVLCAAAAFLAANAILESPPRTRVWVFLAIALDALFIWAVFERRAPLWGRIVSRGRPRTPAVAITFDDGPVEPYTSAILDVLRAFNARATFFVLGARAEQAPTALKRAAADGHEIGNHTWDHRAVPLMTPSAIRRTVRRTSDLIQGQTGARPRVFRAPFGWRNPWLSAALRREGCEAIAWSVGVYDTDRPGVDLIVERAVAGLSDGAIVLLHDGRSLDPQPDASQVVEALPLILYEAKRRGLRLLTVSELLAESRG